MNAPNMTATSLNSSMLENLLSLSVVLKWLFLHAGLFHMRCMQFYMHDHLYYTVIEGELSERLNCPRQYFQAFGGPLPCLRALERFHGTFPAPSLLKFAPELELELRNLRLLITAGIHIIASRSVHSFYHLHFSTSQLVGVKKQN